MFSTPRFDFIDVPTLHLCHFGTKSAGPENACSDLP